jgi:hypothetical protein
MMAPAPFLVKGRPVRNDPWLQGPIDTAQRIRRGTNALAERVCRRPWTSPGGAREPAAERLDYTRERAGVS